jgi:plastocyanin
VIEQAWDSLLEFASQFVIPDWGGLILLLPVFMAIAVVLIFARLIYMYATIGPKRIRQPRRAPIAPPGVHMPGPTFGPILVGFGAFMVFLGLVFGGVWILVGIVVLILTLLYWGREALADYDHVAATHPAQVVVEHAGPPPGVHMPGPSFRPFLVSIGVGLLFLGLVFGGWLLVAGVAFTVLTLLGWLNDARKEYRHVVEADTTGHIENEPAPAWPKKLLWTMAIVILFAVAFDLGWIPPRSAAEGGEPGGSPAPSGGPPGSGAPPGSGGPPAGGITIVAQNIAFDVKSVKAPAGAPFTITFDNEDAGTPHDVDILDAGGAKVFDGKDFPGVATETYNVPALEAGTYKFECSIHPALMFGDLTAGP